MLINRIRLALVATALVLAGCSSSSDVQASAVDTQATTVTQPGRVESVGFGSPEDLVENLIAAIADGDARSLESALPAETWELFGATLLDDFAPSPGDPLCPEVTDNTARCYIFESGFPRVLEVDAQSGAGGWVVTRAVIESTN